MLLGTSIGQDTGPLVRGDGVTLRGAQMSDYPAWAELRALSRSHLTPWEPVWSQDELSRTAFRRRVRHYAREARDDLGYAFLIFDTGNTLVGGLTLSNVRRGVTQSATIGYWLGAPHLGRGLMARAIRAVLPFSFQVLRLHRLDAAVMPQNLSSIRRLEQAGFVREGLARRYLKICGQWEDHLLYALLADDTGIAGRERA